MKKDKEIKSFDDMSVNELVETNSILNDNNDAVAKQLKTAHNYYDVKNFITVLTRFATSEVGANAKVMMVRIDRCASRRRSSAEKQALKRA